MEEHRRKGSGAFFGKHAKNCKRYYHDCDGGLVACLVVSGGLGWQDMRGSVHEDEALPIALIAAK